MEAQAAKAAEQAEADEYVPAGCRAAANLGVLFPNHGLLRKKQVDTNK